MTFIFCVYKSPEAYCHIKISSINYPKKNSTSRNNSGNGSIWTRLFGSLVNSAQEERENFSGHRLDLAEQFL